jgi:hypothetical protein
MSNQRVYKYATIFNARMTNMRHLWEPSREYMGKPQEKPSYLGGFIVAKTRGVWFEEPAFAGLVASCQALYTEAMSHIPFPQVVWPVKDGDIPEPGKAQTEWTKGHWLINGSSTQPIKVEVVQNGVPVPLTNRAIVKPGDFITASVALAVKTNDPRAVKIYLNTVLFMNPGEEIAIGNSVSGAELMAQAKAQGLNVTGFGGTGAPQGGFAQNNAAPAQGGFGQPANPAPQTTGFVQNAPAPVQPNQGGFTAPAGGFTAPQGFPQR